MNGFYAVLDQVKHNLLHNQHTFANGWGNGAIRLKGITDKPHSILSGAEIQQEEY